jgi:hypothetical protein
MTPQEAHDTYLKLGIAWLGAIAGGITLNQLVLGSTLIFTVLQIFMIIRRLWKGLP